MVITNEMSYSMYQHQWPRLVSPLTEEMDLPNRVLFAHLILALASDDDDDIAYWYLANKRWCAPHAQFGEVTVLGHPL